MSVSVVVSNLYNVSDISPDIFSETTHNGGLQTLQTHPSRIGDKIIIKSQENLSSGVQTTPGTNHLISYLSQKFWIEKLELLQKNKLSLISRCGCADGLRPGFFWHNLENRGFRIVSIIFI